MEKITSRQRFVFVFLINLLLSCSHLNLNSNFPSKLMLRSQFCATISFSFQIPRSQTCVFLSFSLSSFLFFFISFLLADKLRENYNLSYRCRTVDYLYAWRMAGMEFLSWWSATFRACILIIPEKQTEIEFNKNSFLALAGEFESYVSRSSQICKLEFERRKWKSMFVIERFIIVIATNSVFKLVCGVV